jgi:hypothetical protein
MIKSKIGQRIAGVFFMALGSGFTAWSWHTAINEGYYYAKAAFFPAFAVVGLGMFLFPMDMEKLEAEHGVDKPTSLAHYPLRWKLIMVLALLAGFGNWWAISHW